MRKQKKGTGALLGVFIGILISFIIVLVVTKVGVNLAQLFSYQKNDEEDFNSLISAIESKQEQQIIYYVSGKHFLIGFNKGEEELNAGFASVKKPVNECKNEACICKCNLDDGDANSYSCLTKARCKQLKDIEKINGIVLEKEKGSIREGKLLIKGKNELPLNIKLEGKELKISTIMQK